MPAPLASVTYEPDPPGLGYTPGDFYDYDFSDDFLTGHGADMAVEGDPPLVSFSNENEPIATSATDGPYNSLFYDPAFYDTTAVTFWLEDDPVIAEET